MFINIGCSVTDFEFTKELSVFDLFQVDIAHGWILDNQDIKTVYLFSYEEKVVEEKVERDIVLL